MSWTDYASAPAPGTRICDTDRVGSVLPLQLATRNGRFPLLILRCRDGFRAYVNACPHQYLPLDHRGDRLLSADGTILMCTVHGARFDIDSGDSVDGVDCGLTPVPIEVRNGAILVASS